MTSAPAPPPSTRGLVRLAGITALLLAVLTLVVALDPPALVHVEHAVGAAALDSTRDHPALEAFWSADARIEQPDFVRLLMLAGVVGLLLLRRWWHAGWLASVLVLSTAVAGVAKQPLARPRPTWADPVASASGYSYPSGHATAGWVFATAAVLLALALLPTSRWAPLLITVAVAAAVVVSLDRVFLGVHYPSDVLGGALLGCLLAVLPWVALSPLRGRREAAASTQN